MTDCQQPRAKVRDQTSQSLILKWIFRIRMLCPVLATCVGYFPVVQWCRDQIWVRRLPGERRFSGAHRPVSQAAWRRLWGICLCI